MVPFCHARNWRPTCISSQGSPFGCSSSSDLHYLSIGNTCATQQYDSARLRAQQATDSTLPFPRFVRHFQSRTLSFRSSKYIVKGNSFLVYPHSFESAVGLRYNVGSIREHLQVGSSVKQALGSLLSKDQDPGDRSTPVVFLPDPSNKMEGVAKVELKYTI